MKSKSIFNRIAAFGILYSLFLPFGLQAASSTSRSVTIGSSAVSAVTTYAFSFKPGTTGNIGAIKFELCDSPLEATGCSNAGDSSGVSFVSNSASILSQSGISGFTSGAGSPPAPTTNTFWITNGTPQSVTTSTVITLTFQNVRNPAVANKEYYGRATTYSNSSGTTEVDFGAVAISTASQLAVSGTMPESLVFCVGITGTDCTNMSGTAVSLGVFSPVATNGATSVMSASTNASFGYVITLVGTSMASGANTIAPMGTQSLNSAGCSPGCSATPGISQFGTNVRANTAPTIGTDVSGSGTATGFSGYNNVNNFRYFAGDTVASVSGVTNSNLFTNSYIVNVSGSQAAGVYTATMTYICTATF